MKRTICVPEYAADHFANTEDSLVLATSPVWGALVRKRITCALT